MDGRRHTDGGADWFDPGSRAAAPPGATAPRRRAPTAGGRRLVPGGSVLVAGLVGLLLALFLNAASVQRTARAMPFGAERTLAVTGSRPFSRVVRVLDAIYRREAAARPGVVFVDTWSLFATPKGAYSAYLRDAHGDLQLMRQSDGVHMTLAGASRLGWAIVTRIERDYRVRDGVSGR